MNLSLVFYIILSTVLAKKDTRPIVNIPKDLSELMTKTAFSCMAQLKATSITVKLFFEFNLPDNDLNREFLYCVCYGTYLADEDGHLSEAMLSLFDENERVDEVRKVFESCNEIKTKKPIVTLFEVVKCFYNNTPVVLGPDLVQY